MWIHIYINFPHIVFCFKDRRQEEKKGNKVPIYSIYTLLEILILKRQ